MLGHTFKRGKVKSVEIIVVLTFGLFVGLVLGYMIMGTAHAILEIGAEEHFKHTKV